MEKLFAALREEHPGYEVVDIRLLANAAEVNGVSAAKMDAEFARAIVSAKEVDITTLKF